MPYGPDRSTNALLNQSAYKYTDQEQDASTGLYNYDAQYYYPNLGQFVMADTIVPDPFNPQSINRYTYCLNNPLIYTDPTGHHTGGDNGPGLGDEGPGGYSFGSMRGCRGGGAPGYDPPSDLSSIALEIPNYSVTYSTEVLKPDQKTQECMQCIAEEIEKDIEVTSGLRPGDDGKHGKGKAADLGKKNNSSLTAKEIEAAYKNCFDVNNSYAIEEERCFHFQTAPGKDNVTGWGKGLRDSNGKSVK